ncbi:MAG: SpoIIE family protein phosphatase [Atopobiaceae bacterium]|nr:SpoIIE family protein phosphatase [Atopobiaceae bacterium]MBR3313206.1 SpoIIE family protein phosphatase [Atopobiaceae bacterium]
MNDLCADIGYKSIKHVGEELCGDHVDIVEKDDGSTVVVLADGLGSGVRASILSTLTSKIISTMMAADLSIEECVSTIAETLPVSGNHGVAYSTFTIIQLVRNHTAELIQYDNPYVILIRDGVVTDYPMTGIDIEGKKIYRSTIRLQEGDVFVAMSDGCPHASADRAYNNDWKREDIAEYMAEMSLTGYTAKVLCTMLVDECDKLYGYHPLDDATACVVRIRQRVPMNILFGPPADRDDCNKMLNLFFGKEGKHIICGGTTATIASKYLRKPIKAKPVIDTTSDVPPISEIDGVDLVTEGVITMSRVVEYAKNYLRGNESYEEWNYGHDGASRICQLLFEEATDINFFVGRAINPAHQNPNLPINFNIKMSIVDDLTASLREMGKRVKVSYF